MSKLHVASIMVLLASTLLLATCKQKEQDSTGIRVKMNCVKLDYETVKKWHDAGWTKDIGYLFLQFYSGEVSNSNKNLEILTYPAKDYSSFFGDSTVLTTISDTCSEKLNGKVVYGNLVIRFKALNLIDSTSGALKKFKYIKLTPKKLTSNNVAFDVEVIDDNGVPLPTDPAGRQADPCPPYCPISPFAAGLMGEVKDDDD